MVARYKMLTGTYGLVLIVFAYASSESKAGLSPGQSKKTFAVRTLGPEQTNGIFHEAANNKIRMVIL